jgi:hypothetical protein
LSLFISEFSDVSERFTMNSLFDYYTTHWNPSFSGDADLLNRKIALACDVISNSVNKVDILNVPYYYLDNVKKAVCAEADSISLPASADTDTSGSSDISSSFSYHIGSFSVSEKSSSGSSNSNAGGVETASSGDNFSLCPAAKSYLLATGLLHNTAVVA